MTWLLRWALCQPQLLSQAIKAGLASSLTKSIVWYNINMENKTRFRIMPTETYIVTVGNHNEEMSGIDILAILEAAFDEALENEANYDYES
jgi:hypothetical protein